jgi:chemotaxis protein MotA
VSRRPDYTTFAGLAVAAAGILGGLALERGQAQDLAQATAALIVMGGTAGALLISTPRSSLTRALRRGATLFFEEARDDRAVIERIVGFSMQARRRGVVSLEEQATKEEDRFLRKALLLAVDGVDSAEIRRQLESEIRIEDNRADADAKVFETAGGYAPTIGIIGAVLGLIQVMKQLENIGGVGRGIAMAFVATIYGVGGANLLLFPAAAKIRARAARKAEERELMMEGILMVAEGLHPFLVRSRLEGYLERAGRPATPERAAAGAAAEGIRA